MALRILPWFPLAIFALPLFALGAWLLDTSGAQSFCSFAVSCALLFVIVAMLARTWRLLLLALTPVLVLSAAFTIYTLSYGSPPGDFLAYVLATSTWEEIWGFFGLWQAMRWLLPLGIVVVLYCALSVCVAPRPIFAEMRPRVRWGIIGALSAMGAYSAINPVALINGFAANPLLGTVLFVIEPLAHARAAVNGNAISKVDFRPTHVTSEEVHVLVIGESARRDSWSVYGYGRHTTPYLESLRGEAIFLQHAMADANFTVCVVPILLTGMNPAHFSMAHIRGNLVDLAQQAGYSTAWLMNQDPHISLLSGVHANYMLYPPAISTLVSGHLPLDEVLLPELRRALAKRGLPRFIGLHTIGSHWIYSSRYPPAFERFGSARGLTYDSTRQVHADPRVVTAYDNSVAYTDWMLSQIIEQVRALEVPATVTYFADHGEDLYALDGNSGHGTAFFTAHQFAVPAFIWVNSAYRRTHPERVQALENNASLEIRSHNLFYSMAQIMGIQWPGERPSESFASANFVPDLSSPRIAGGVLVSADMAAATP